MVVGLDIVNDQGHIVDRRARWIYKIKRYGILTI